MSEYHLKKVLWIGQRVDGILYKRGAWYKLIFCYNKFREVNCVLEALQDVVVDVVREEEEIFRCMSLI